MTCPCIETDHPGRLVVLTGGPGAGKTAVLEVVRRALCEHVVILPESATVLFGGGFPRHDTLPGRRAAQEAIFHVQRAMESMVGGERRAAVALCDRGTLDGLAYWPGGWESGCKMLGIDLAEELARYHAVIHLQTPSIARGYDHSNPVRTESAEQALLLDARISQAWEQHPRRVIIESDADFVRKLGRAVGAIRDQLPPCCRAHPVPELAEAASDGSCSPPRPCSEE